MLVELMNIMLWMHCRILVILVCGALLTGVLMIFVLLSGSLTRLQLCLIIYVLFMNMTKRRHASLARRTNSFKSNLV